MLNGNIMNKSRMFYLNPQLEDANKKKEEEKKKKEEIAALFKPVAQTVAKGLE